MAEGKYRRLDGPLGQWGQGLVPQESSVWLQDCLLVCAVSGSCIWVLAKCHALVPTLVGEKIRTRKAYHHENMNMKTWHSGLIQVSIQYL